MDLITASRIGVFKLTNDQYFEVSIDGCIHKLRQHINAISQEILT